jgi:hypothetical protein
MQGIFLIHAKVRAELDEKNTLYSEDEDKCALSPGFALQALAGGGILTAKR